MTQALSFIAESKQLIDEAIAQELQKRLQEAQAISPHLIPVIKAMQELSVGGKRLRATLTFLGYQLAGGTQRAEVVRAAAAMEVFHLGLLIQDDVMDGDSLRRGIATIHSRYPDLHLGEAVAVNAGDICYGWVIEMLAGLHFPPEKVNQALAVWGKYFVRVGYGQVLDVLDIADEATILQILSIKSGEYSCVLPLLLGATLGGGSPELLLRLEQYGMELGQVFQLRDDWLGMYGDKSKTGKPAGEQADKGKKTFATMYGQEKTEAAIAEHLTEGLKLAAGDPVLEGLLQWVATRES
jgi:geranylgeranyl diphosphate synthase type I